MTMATTTTMLIVLDDCVLAERVVSSANVLLVTAVTLSNTQGLVMIIFLLGYGLVELPKLLWLVSPLPGR
jgi:hypothetical protein